MTSLEIDLHVIFLASVLETVSHWLFTNSLLDSMETSSTESLRNGKLELTSVKGINYRLTNGKKVKVSFFLNNKIKYCYDFQHCINKKVFKKDIKFQNYQTFSIAAENLPNHHQQKLRNIAEQQKVPANGLINYFISF